MATKNDYIKELMQLRKVNKAMYEALQALLDEYQISDTDSEVNVSANWIKARQALTLAKGKE